MADKIQVRRDTAANWTTNNPVLADGEPGFESDTGKLKIGNGTSNYSTLTSIGGSSGGASGYDDILNAIAIKRGTTTAGTYLQSGFADGFQTNTGVGSTVAFNFNAGSKIYANYGTDNVIMRFNNSLDNIGSTVLTSAPVSAGNGAIAYSSTTKKYGSHALSCNGTAGTGSNMITFPSNNNLFNHNNDFCVQMWIYPNSISGRRYIFSTASNIRGSDGFSLQCIGGTLGLGYNNNDFVGSTFGTIAANVWTHIAMCRVNGSHTIYVNGNSRGSFTFNHTYGGFYLGGCMYDGYQLDPFSGFIDDLCINKTTATYTANFTPPAIEAGNTSIATGNITSIPLTAQSAPKSAKIIVSTKVSTTGGAIPANFSIEGSRDNGTTWSEASSITVAPQSIDGTTSMVYGDVDLSGQPSGTQVKYRIGYKNSITAEFYGAGVIWS
jgi:hypothetical protein